MVREIWQWEDDLIPEMYAKIDDCIFKKREKEFMLSLVTVKYEKIYQ